MPPAPDPMTDNKFEYGAVEEKETRDDELRPLISTKYRRPANTLCSCRYIVSYMTFFGFMVAFMNRVNISVAITAMVNSTYSANYDADNSSGEFCPARSDDSESEESITEGEFPWDTHTQEQILAAFYYGFPFLQIPAGVMADKHPWICPWVIGLGYLLSSISSLFIPLAAYNGGAPAIIALRIVSGLSESGIYPSIYSMMSRWAPEAERGKLLAITFAGTSVGEIVAQPISGILSASDFLGGWPSTFYLFGSMGMIWFVPWLLLVYPYPAAHPRISDEEKDYIMAALKPQENQPPKKYPWKQFLTSMPLFAVCVADFALLWILYSLTANLPIYMTEVLRFDVTTSGILSSVPHIALFICILGGGFLADYLLLHTRFSLTAVRKIMTTLGTFPAGAFLVLAAYAGCNAPLAITCLSLGLGLTGLAYSGASLTMMEFATPYAGMVVAIANTIATIPGFISPLVVAVFTENQADIEGWRTFFWISFGITVAAWLIFMVFGTSELQSWAKGVKGGGGIESQDNQYGGTIKSDYEYSSEKEILLSSH